MTENGAVGAVGPATLAAERAPEVRSARSARSTRWTFLTNHGHVLVALSRNPEARVRDLAETVGITERATQAILGDLEQARYVTRQRVGRRNTYQLHVDRALRHPAESDHDVGELLALFGS